MPFNDPRGSATRHDATNARCGAVSVRDKARCDGILPPPPEQKRLEIDLAPFDEALRLLSAGPLRALVYDQRAEIEKGIRCVSTGLEAAASVELARMPAEQAASLVRTFLTRRDTTARNEPFVHYGMIANPPLPQDTPSPESYTHMAHSLLATGLLPKEDVRESIELARISLLNQSTGPVESSASWFATSAVLATWMLYPPTVSSVITACYLARAAASFRDRAIAANVAEGYILETLDSHRAVSTGQVSTIGAALHAHFGNPADTVNYSNHWRSDGFAIARALRILRHPTDKIFELFRDHAGIHQESNPLVMTVRTVLTNHDIPVPPSMLFPFIEEPEDGERYDATHQFLELMNEVYFASALADKEIVRRDFAKLVAGDTNAREAA